MVTRGGRVVAAPDGFPGTLPEWLVFEELTKRQIDFNFQSNQFGGRLEKGGLVIDFLIPPDLAFSVLGIYFHYSLGGSGSQARDLMAREILAQQGIEMIFLDEDDILNDVQSIVDLGLQRIDRSRMARR